MGTVLLSVLLLVFQQQNGEVKGWYKATWGIDQDSIAKLFPEATSPRYRDAINGKYTCLELRDYDVLGEKFTVAFRMDSKTHLLVGVRLTYLDNFPSVVFDKFNEMLTGKYGSPNSKEDSRDNFGTSKTRIWALEKTRIKFECEDGRLLKAVKLEYIMKDNEGPSKY
jgi:hypothetical protein